MKSWKIMKIVRILCSLVKYLTKRSPQQWALSFHGVFRHLPSFSRHLASTSRLFPSSFSHVRHFPSCPVWQEMTGFGVGGPTKAPILGRASNDYWDQQPIIPPFSPFLIKNSFFKISLIFYRYPNFWSKIIKGYLTFPTFLVIPWGKTILYSCW